MVRASVSCLIALVAHCLSLPDWLYVSLLAAYGNDTGLIDPTVRSVRAILRSYIEKSPNLDLNPLQVPSDDDSALAYLGQLLPGLLYDPSSVLVLDEIQAAPDLARALITFVHTNRDTGSPRFHGRLVLLGTPPIGDAIPITLDAHRYGKQTSLFVESFNIVCIS